VILRGVKGRDNAGRKITTDPIFLHEKTSLPYRYMFLQEEFDQSMALADIPVESGHRDLDLQDIAVGAQSTFNKIIDWRMALTDRMRTNGKTPQLASRKQTIKALSQSQFTSQAELTQAVVVEVFDEEDDDDLFFVDDVM
ncbi:TPA: type IV secretory system conjugative DNA transfer family protein, partial [Streptococcus agalactiae]